MDPWQDLVTVALLGTERQPTPLPAAPGPLGTLLAGLSGADREEALLGAAAALALYRRAGQVPAQDPAPLPPPCPPDPQPAPGPQAAHHLAQMLHGPHGDVLTEWLTALAARGGRVPDSALPALLDKGRMQDGLRPRLLPVLGTRGRWLAAQNPDWDYVAGGVEDEGIWETGSRAARVLLLAQRRARDPAAARELLAGTWASESADDRAVFLAELENGLSLADEPFLEAALDDRRKEVRRAAAGLLARLPDSALVGRMIARVRPLLAYTPPASGGLLRRGRKAALEVTLPEACDKAMTRDGIDAQQAAGYGQKAGWLHQMVSVVPPATWTALWDVEPAALIAAATANTDWRHLLNGAWIAATLRHADRVWAAAILAAWPLKDAPMELAPMLAILPPADREAFLLQHFQAPHLLETAKHGPELLDALSACARPWSRGLADAVLAYARQITRLTPAGPGWHLRYRLPDFALALPPEMAAHAATGWPTTGPVWSQWATTVDEFLARLQFRHDMYQALDGKQ